MQFLKMLIKVITLEQYFSDSNDSRVVEKETGKEFL